MGTEKAAFPGDERHLCLSVQRKGEKSGNYPPSPRSLGPGTVGHCQKPSGKRTFVQSAPQWPQDTEADLRLGFKIMCPATVRRGSRHLKSSPPEVRHSNSTNPLWDPEWPSEEGDSSWPVLRRQESMHDPGGPALCPLEGGREATGGWVLTRPFGSHRASQAG